MRRSILPLIERAVLVALASACSSSNEQGDAGAPDASDEPSADATTEAAADATDEFVDDGGVLEAIAPLPLPDGCVVTGKPDVFAPCGYSENINDPIACGIDIDADTQQAGVCYVLCDPTEPDCVYYDLGNGDAGDTYIVSCGAGCIGRLHEEAREEIAGTCAHLRRDRGAILARDAELEAASVFAFAIVARDLARFAAPRELVDAAERSADDEMRHAHVVGALARRFGGAPREAARPAEATRDRRAFAIENAVEGCVRETFGAALAAWQAARATDPAVRDAMREIARDEALHADLGWRIDAWLASVGAEDETRAMRGARAASVCALEGSLDAYGAGDAALGLPSCAEAKALFDALASSVWRDC